MDPNETVDLVDVELVEDEPRAWGFWATVGLSLVVFIAFMILQIVVVIVFVLVVYFAKPGTNPTQIAEQLAFNGLLLSLTTCITTPFAVGLVVLFAKLRKGLTARQYLALQWVPGKTLFMWLALLLVLAGCSEALNFVSERPLIPEFMTEAYQSAGFLPLLWITLIVAAPVFEEVFFRGFLFRGIEQSKLGGPGAILITSFVWAASHLQYGVFEITVIFVLGIFLGMARRKSQSVYLTIFLHAVWNLIATIEVAVYLS